MSWMNTMVRLLTKFTMSMGLKLLCGYILSLPAPQILVATPLIALREAQNCGGCHKPGRSQRPFFERRCTLDCQGCHIQPDGGGARNQWGTYYSHDQLAMRNFFSPIDPLQDTSRFDLHTDARVMQWWKAGGEHSIFPMAWENTVRVRPFINYLHLSYSNLLLGRINDKQFRILNEGGRRFREKYSVMIDALPLNTYVRAYRGTPMYGLKRPNHSLWIRQGLGLDQFATTDAYEIGLTPNVPFFRASLMQGDPYVEAPFRQKGYSYHGGVRGVSFAWHLNSSGWATQSESHAIDMQAVGGGFQVLQTIFYGERNWRKVSQRGEPSPTLRVHPASTIGEYNVAFAGIRGLMLGLVKEDRSSEGKESDRLSFFVDVHPIPFVQFEIWRRQETGARELTDTLGLMHLYADF